VVRITMRDGVDWGFANEYLAYPGASESAPSRAGMESLTLLSALSRSRPISGRALYGLAELFQSPIGMYVLTFF
jgi:hypothetical protein